MRTIDGEPVFGPIDYHDPITNHDGGQFMTIEEFIDNCRFGAYTDYDGYGYPYKNGMIAPDVVVLPSDVESMPPDATHILWFNR